MNLIIEGIKLKKTNQQYVDFDGACIEEILSTTRNNSISLLQMIQ